MRYIYLCILLLCVSNLHAQDKKGQSDFKNLPFWSFSLGYGGDLPIGDLSDRFGYNLGVIGKVEYTHGNNFLWGITAEQKFGNQVKEDVFETLYSSKGRLLASNNRLSEAYLRMRGVYVGAHIGKVFRISKNTRSGLRCTLGAGLTSHYIRIADENNSLAQILGEYKTGYDRLTRGIAVREFIGYQHISQDRLINFTIGLDFMQAFTKSIREFNFSSSELKPKQNRFDGYIGIKVSWILPFYRDYEADEIYY